MVNSTPAFSSISTPSSYPESGKRTNARFLDTHVSHNRIKNGECLCINQCS
jgi:hypothetical protein